MFLLPVYITDTVAVMLPVLLRLVSAHSEVTHTHPLTEHDGNDDMYATFGFFWIVLLVCMFPCIESR
jgi:hypothetical protein